MPPRSGVALAARHAVTCRPADVVGPAAAESLALLPDCCMHCVEELQLLNPCHLDLELRGLPACCGGRLSAGRQSGRQRRQRCLTAQRAAAPPAAIMHAVPGRAARVHCTSPAHCLAWEARRQPTARGASRQLSLAACMVPLALPSRPGQTARPLNCTAGPAPGPAATLPCCAHLPPPPPLSALAGVTSRHAQGRCRAAACEEPGEGGDAQGQAGESEAAEGQRRLFAEHVCRDAQTACRPPPLPSTRLPRPRSPARRGRRPWTRWRACRRTP